MSVKTSSEKSALMTFNISIKCLLTTSTWTSTMILELIQISALVVNVSIHISSRSLHRYRWSDGGIIFRRSDARLERKASKSNHELLFYDFLFYAIMHSSWLHQNGQLNWRVKHLILWQCNLPFTHIKLTQFNFQITWFSPVSRTHWSNEETRLS